MAHRTRYNLYWLCLEYVQKASTSERNRYTPHKTKVYVTHTICLVSPKLSVEFVGPLEEKTNVCQVYI